MYKLKRFLKRKENIMTKERLKKQYNVDADKVIFKECENYGYKWETTRNSKYGYYINRKDDNYQVIDANTNSVVQFRHDLSDLEDIK